MMRRIALLFLPVAIGMMAAGCSTLERNIDNPNGSVDPEILVHKSFLAKTSETKTTLDGTTVLFSKGEAISIYDGTANREFKADEAGANVSFSGEVSPTATEFYALSPYSESAVFSKSGSTVTAKTSLASSQVATPGSFEDGMNISAAKADSYDQFSLVNVMGVAKFTLDATNLGGHRIVSVELTSSYPLSGDVVVTYGENPSAVAGSNTVNTVSISKVDGSSFVDGTYYMVVLPNAGGEISLKFTDADGYSATKTATLKSAFEAGSIKNLGTVKGLDWVAPSYTKVTSAPADGDWTGDYLIVYETDKQLLGKVADNLGIPYDVTISDGNTISWDTYNTYNIAIAKSGDGYSLDLNNTGYLGYTGSSNSLTYTSESLTDKYRWALSIDSSGNVAIKNLANTDRIIKYNASATRFCAYTSASTNVKAVQLYKRTSEESAPVTGPAAVTLTTEEASNVRDMTATLNASFSDLSPLNAQEVGFYWGTDPSSLTEIVYDNSFVPQSSGSLSAVLTTLDPETTYYYQVTMQVWDRTSNSYKEFRGEVKSFTTAEAYIPTPSGGWLELPAVTGSEDYLGTFYSGKYRNYSYNYSTDWYASLWVAYPLTNAQTSGSASSSWKFVPESIIPEQYQVHIVANSYGRSYGNDAYSRGHQIPNADRKSDDTMNQQTYYAINQTPQLQNKFNGSIWSSLENDVRAVAKNTDTLYVATGPAYHKIGASEESIKYLTAASSGITPAKLAIPNYFWKVLLKVTWNNKGEVTAASAIGFWFEHKEYNNSTYANYAVSVNQIESWTGLDLFANLPDDLEETVEANSNWSTFQNF